MATPRSRARAGAAAALCALALLCSGAAATSASSNILVLNGDAAFDAALAAHDFLVVDFYAPWCAFCKKLEPEYAAAADTLKAAGVPVTLAMLDATLPDNAALAARFGVTGYPTLKMFRDHSSVEGMQEFSGGRDADDIVSYLIKQAGTTAASTKLDSAADAAALAQKEEVVIFGVFPAGSTEEEEAFLSVAASLRNDYVFAHVADAALLPSSDAGDTIGPHVVMLKKYDTPRVATTDLSADALRAWVEAQAQPRVARLGSKDSKHMSAVRRMVAAKVPRVFVFGEFDNAGAADAQFLAAVMAAAAAHPELNFIAADAAQNKDTVSFFTLTHADLPAAVVHDTSSGDKKYTRPRITPDGLEAFLSDFQAGALAPLVKSAPIPMANSAPVTMLVADNFEAAVGLPAAAGKTFLFYFYATWCEPCQTMAPVYEEVGEHFAGRDDVVIAKMDADANTVTLDRFKVMRFPTLYLQTSSGEALRYTGERTKEALTAFVEHFAAAAAKNMLVGAAAAAELQAEL